MRRVMAWARWLLSLSIPPFLLLSNLYFLASPAFIDYEYSKGGWPLPPRYDDRERREVAKKVLFYIHSSEGISYLGNLADEEGTLFNQRELVHLVDVKVLFQRATLFHRGLLVLVLGAATFLLGQREGRRVMPRALLGGALLTFVLFGAVGLFAALGFDAFFVGFHRTFFAGDSWLFLSSDTLIQLFPLSFWFDAAMIWMGMTLGEAAVLGAAGHLGVRLIKRPS